METLPNFTPRVQQALAVAKELAQASFSSEVNLTHLFLGVVGLQTEFIHHFFLRNDLDLEELTNNLTNDVHERASKQALTITQEASAEGGVTTYCI